MRDFRSHPRAVREASSKGSEALLTVNGRPLAILLSVNAKTYEHTLDVLRRAQALQVPEQIGRRAKTTGRDLISMDEVEAEIVAVRRQARMRNRKAGRG